MESRDVDFSVEAISSILLSLSARRSSQIGVLSSTILIPIWGIPQSFDGIMVRNGDTDLSKGKRVCAGVGGDEL